MRANQVLRRIDFASYASKNRFLAIIVFLDETPVGVILLCIDSDYADGIDCPGVFLWRLMIAGPYQNMGYGRKALELVVHRLKALGIPELHTCCGLGEASPQEFYLKFGFVPTGDCYGDEIELVYRLTAE